MDKWKYNPSRRLFLKNLGIVTVGIPILGSRAYAMLANRMMMGAAGAGTYPGDSNASLLDLDCSNLTGWTDGDSGNGVSGQVTYDGKSCFKFDAVIGAVGTYAERFQDLGSIDGLGNQIVVTLLLYCNTLGTLAAPNKWQLYFQRSDWRFRASYASDGLFVYNGASDLEIGTNIVQTGAWQKWTFVIDVSGGVASAIVTTYLNEVLIAAGTDCSYTIASTDGLTALNAFGWTIATLAHLDYLKIGDGFV